MLINDEYLLCRHITDMCKMCYRRLKTHWLQTGLDTTAQINQTAVFCALIPSTLHSSLQNWHPKYFHNLNGRHQSVRTYKQTISLKCVDEVGLHPVAGCWRQPVRLCVRAQSHTSHQGQEGMSVGPSDAGLQGGKMSH